MKLLIQRWLWLGVLVCSVDGMAAPQQDILTEGQFALVEDQVVTSDEHRVWLEKGSREKFYHGQPPEAEFQKFVAETEQGLIEDALLAGIARERGLMPDQSEVEVLLSKAAKKDSHNPLWSRIESALRVIYTRQSLVRQLQASQEFMPTVSDRQIKEFYSANLSLFTEPPQYHLSVIMLKVPPWESSAKWEERQLELKSIHQRIVSGASFEEMASDFSNDITASNGGDMGYLHSGMISKSAEAAVADLKAGEMTEPLRMLEGYALFRLNSKREQVVRPLKEVVDRAKKILEQQLRDKAWKDFKALMLNRADVMRKDKK